MHHCPSAARSRLLHHLTIMALCVAAVVWPGLAQAQPAAKAAGKPPARTAQAGTPGYRVERTPEWVKPVKPSGVASTATSGTPGYRITLMDAQTLLGHDGSEQAYTHTRALITDSAGVQVLSKAEIYFNPAFQTVALHEAVVWRNGAKLDRLKDARIELLRREEGLERLTLTGVQTLLVLLNDVRLGDTVEVAYTVRGANPIYKGHYADTFQLGFGAAVDELQLRIEAPASRTLHTRGIRSDAVPERSTQGGRQVLQLTRRNIPAVLVEDSTPPWFKVYPALHVSDYADWQQVATWAEELFAHPGELGPELQGRIEAWRAKGLPREQLAAEVVEFVQDEVRYFSVSLGESSHRPKPPAKTMAERLGDCKDKTALLNAILQRLGFDAKPALISMRRNRGIAEYLPAHDQFDHVITQLTLDGTIYWIDPTMQKQGRPLHTRGVVPYGSALVVSPGTTGLSKVTSTPAQGQQLEWDSVWDASDLKRHPTFTTTLRARGLSAEGWRQSAGTGGPDRLASAIAGAYARLLPGLKATGSPVVRDNRDTNVFELEMQYEVPGLGQYERGALVVELPALELLDSLTGPREVRRDMPFLVDQPLQVKQRLRAVAPHRFSSQPPPPAEAADRHFRLATRYEVNGNTFDYLITYERRSDEVLPADLNGFRERLQAARRLGGVSVRLPLLSLEPLRAQFDDIDRHVTRKLGRQSDTLREIVVRQEIERLFATELLRQVGDSGPLAGPLLERRAIANSSLADYDATLADADRALAKAPEASYSHYTRGLALMSLGRGSEALSALQQFTSPSSRALLQMGIGGAQYYQGEFSNAERSFSEAVQESSGNDRVFALSWLYIASQKAGGKGRSAVLPHLADVSRSSWPGVLVHYLAGEATQDELLERARENKSMERLNLSEAYFYVGQQLLLAGKAAEAKRMFRRTVELQATPYREYALAELELKRSEP
jgi:lipoprotein NlpI